MVAGYARALHAVIADSGSKHALNQSINVFPVVGVKNGSRLEGRDDSGVRFAINHFLRSPRRKPGPSHKRLMPGGARFYAFAGFRRSPARAAHRQANAAAPDRPAAAQDTYREEPGGVRPRRALKGGKQRRCRQSVSGAFCRSDRLSVWSVRPDGSTDLQWRKRAF